MRDRGTWFIYFFAAVFALAACSSPPPDNQGGEQMMGSPAPETRQPGKPPMKQSDVINHLRKDPHLRVQQLSNSNKILVEMRSGDSFQRDSVSPSRVLTGVLDYIAGVLNNSGNIYEISVIGHTDNLGSQQVKMHISEERALAAALYLADKGFDRRRLSYEGKGSQEPIADNSSQEGRDVNRRVDLLISPVRD